jgi:hypothetical protein
MLTELMKEKLTGQIIQKLEKGKSISFYFGPVSIKRKNLRFL